MCGGERTAFVNLPSPSTMWLPEIKPKSSGLATSVSNWLSHGWPLFLKKIHVGRTLSFYLDFNDS